MSPADTCVVAQHVYPTEPGNRSIRERLNRVFPRHVRRHGKDLTRGGQRLLCSRKILLVDIGDDDLHAFLQESLRETQSDTVRPAGDDGNAAAQILHAAPHGFVRHNSENSEKRSLP